MNKTSQVSEMGGPAQKYTLNHNWAISCTVGSELPVSDGDSGTQRDSGVKCDRTRWSSQSLNFILWMNCSKLNTFVRKKRFIENRQDVVEKRVWGENSVLLESHTHTHTWKHTDGCIQSWPVVGLCCHWISRRRRCGEQKMTLVLELESWCTVKRTRTLSGFTLNRATNTTLHQQHILIIMQSYALFSCLCKQVMT